MKIRVAKRDNGSYIVQRRFLIFWWRHSGTDNFWGDHAKEEAFCAAREILARDEDWKRRRKRRRVVETLDVN